MNSTPFGIRVNADVATVDVGFKTFITPASSYINFGFFLNKNTIAIAGAGQELLFTRLDGSTNTFLDFKFRRVGTSIYLVVSGGALTTELISLVLPAGSLQISVLAQEESAPAANDGICTLFVNSVLEDQELGINNGFAFSDIAANGTVVIEKTEGGAITGNCYVDEIVLRNDNSPLFPAGFTIAPMHQPAAIDADGDFIYIAALQTTPVLIKFATALNADGTIVFDPGAGTDIGIQCGRFDADVVWIAGDFNSTNAVEKSENAGTSFTVKDPGTFGIVSAFIVGPDSDERVLIFDSADGEISETIDDGVSWSQKKTGLGYDCFSIDRLDINPEECVFGNQASATNLVNYSPNTGQNLEDYTPALPITQDVIGVIVN
jgi:hypothetical protein